ncbi:hypothetical protein [Mycobacterium sp. 23]|uniref:hypothetical protein n=1 Tax=Mycobacterium sp. 23 TaxID=3400424 RepID=UPI003AAABBBD
MAAAKNLSPQMRSLRASLASNTSWAHTEDRAARTAAARAAAMDRFEREVDPEGVLTPAERAKRAANARKAHFQRMAYASAKARQRRKGNAA